MDPKAPIAQSHLPWPMPVSEIEGKTVFCGTRASAGRPCQARWQENHPQVFNSQGPLALPGTRPAGFLQGGPGGSAISQIQLYAGTFGGFRKTRDVVLFDQRSAGLSGQSVKCFNALAANAAKIVLKQDTTTDISGSNKDSNTVATA